MFERPILTLIPTVNCKLGHNLDHIPASLERRECSAPMFGDYLDLPNTHSNSFQLCNNGCMGCYYGYLEPTLSEGFKAQACLLLSCKGSYIDTWGLNRATPSVAAPGFSQGAEVNAADPASLDLRFSKGPSRTPFQNQAKISTRSGSKSSRHGVVFEGFWGSPKPAKICIMSTEVF